MSFVREAKPIVLGVDLILGSDARTPASPKSHPWICSALESTAERRTICPLFRIYPLISEINNS